jgi:hypothetical protein
MDSYFCANWRRGVERGGGLLSCLSSSFRQNCLKLGICAASWPDSPVIVIGAHRKMLPALVMILSWTLDVMRAIGQMILTLYLLPYV